MPPFILAAAGIIGAVALVRFIAREGRRVNGELDELRNPDLQDTGGLPTLQRDPETGAYRPK